MAEMKVLMCGNHPSNKGGMTSVINQINNYSWNEKGIELTFIPTFIPGNLIKKTFYFCCAYIRILCLMVFDRPDIVHMHMSYKGSFIRKYAIHRLCIVFKVKDIIHLHGSEFEKWYNEADEKNKAKIRELLSGCNAIIVLGNRWKKTIKRIEPSAKVIEVSNGISIPKETVQWNDECCCLLFLGVLIPRKGISDLINAIALIRDCRRDDIKLVIAGTGEDEEKLKQLVTDNNLEDRISFAGWVSEEKKKNLLLQSQVFVLPSYNEGLPISILEAASYGMPVISTDVGDIPSVVKNDVNGFLLKPGDVKCLADAIIKISNRELFLEMSENAKETIRREFSVEMFYKNLLHIYETM